MLQFDSAGDLQEMPEYFNMDHADNGTWWAVQSAYCNQKNREKYEENMSNRIEWMWSCWWIWGDFMKNWWSCGYSKGGLPVNIRFRDGNEPSGLEPSTSSHFHEISSASRAEHGFLDSSTSRAINSPARLECSWLCSIQIARTAIRLYLLYATIFKHGFNIGPVV